MAKSVIIIDTSVWIPCLRRGTPPAIQQRVRDLVQSNQAATAGPVFLEVLGGARDAAEYRRLSAEFGALIWIDVTPNTWRAAARDAFDLRRHGISVPFTDALIARTALDAGCTVLHHDRHFPMISKVTGVLVENM